MSPSLVLDPSVHTSPFLKPFEYRPRSSICERRRNLNRHLSSRAVDCRRRPPGRGDRRETGALVAREGWAHTSRPCWIRACQCSLAFVCEAPLSSLRCSARRQGRGQQTVRKQWVEICSERQTTTTIAPCSLSLPFSLEPGSLCRVKNGGGSFDQVRYADGTLKVATRREWRLVLAKGGVRKKRLLVVGTSLVHPQTGSAVVYIRCATPQT